MANSHYSVGLSQQADDIRFGYTNQQTYIYSQSRDRTIINGINLFITLMNKFINAFNKVNVESLTFLNQKDLFISIALGKMIRCCQTVDSAYEQLTPHATLYWKDPLSYHKLWGSVPLSYLNTNTFDIGDGYYGPAGSLGFYLYKYKIDTNNLTPVQIIQVALDAFWSELSISTGVSPFEQHNTILANVGLSSISFDEYTKALNYIWNNPNVNSTTLSIVRSLRADAVSIKDFSSLKQQLMFATIKPSVLQALTTLQFMVNNYTDIKPLPPALNLTNINPNTFKTILTNVLDICKPAGFNLIYQAFAIQSLVRASKVIINSDLNIVSGNYYNAIRYGQNTSLLLDIAQNLSTMYDAYAALAYFNNLQEARGLSYFAFQKVVELINYDSTTVIPFDNNNFRLHGFK